MRAICMLAACLAAAGCGQHRDYTEYALDENTFDSEAMAKIEQETGFVLPDGAKGLAFYHIPPVDPVVFAIVQIPGNAEESVTDQIRALQETEFPGDFAYDRCDRWPPAPEHILLTKRAFSNGYHIELHLVKEGEQLLLYIQYFTM